MATVDRKLWLTADRSTLVEDGDPRAAILWASTGDDVPDDAADLGYSANEPEAKESKVDAEDKAVAEPEETKAAPTKTARKRK